MKALQATTAADIAVVLFAVFGAVEFGWRSWLEHRRTGSNGFRGLSGRIPQRANVPQPHSIWLRTHGDAYRGR